MKYAYCLSLVKKTTPYLHHELEVEVELANGATYTIFQKYSSFLDLQSRLKSQYGEKVKAIPELPTLGFISKMFGQEKKLKKTNEFLQGLCGMTSEVLEGNIVNDFFSFHPTLEERKKAIKRENAVYKPPVHRQHPCSEEATVAPLSTVNHHTQRAIKQLKQSATAKQKEANTAQIAEDPQLSTTKTVRGSDPLCADNHGQEAQQSRPADMIEQHEKEAVDLFTAIESFKGQDSNELSISKGDTVKVLEKSFLGWWYVLEEESHREGWVPGTFLAPLPSARSRSSSLKSKGTKCIVAHDYSLAGSTSVSLAAGSHVLVLEASDDGWWLVRSSAFTGKVPATLLLPCVEESHDETSNKESSMTESQEDIYGMIHQIRRENHLTRRGPPPAPPSRYKADLTDAVYTRVNFTNHNCSQSTQESSPKPQKHSAPKPLDRSLPNAEVVPLLPPRSPLSPRRCGSSQLGLVQETDSEKKVKPPISPKPMRSAARTNPSESTAELVYADLDLSAPTSGRIRGEKSSVQYTTVVPVSLPPLNIGTKQQPAYENVFSKTHTYSNVDIRDSFAASIYPSEQQTS